MRGLTRRGVVSEPEPIERRKTQVRRYSSSARAGGRDWTCQQVEGAASESLASASQSQKGEEWRTREVGQREKLLRVVTRVQ